MGQAGDNGGLYVIARMVHHLKQKEDKKEWMGFLSPDLGSEGHHPSYIYEARNTTAFPGNSSILFE